jgi:hypothetical protein
VQVVAVTRSRSLVEVVKKKVFKKGDLSQPVYRPHLAPYVFYGSAFMAISSS